MSIVSRLKKHFQVLPGVVAEFGWLHLARQALEAITPPILFRLVDGWAFGWRRSRCKKQLAGARRLHLACGNNVMPDWTNVDLYGREGVVGWDLSRPLPVTSNSIEFVYNEHFIEHIPKESAIQLIEESYRVLQSGGILRISTPSLDKIVGQYTEGKLDEWEDMAWLPASTCDLLNEGMRLWGHEYLYNETEIFRLLHEAGFSEIRRVPWRQSAVTDLADIECRPFHDELIIEAVK